MDDDTPLTLLKLTEQGKAVNLDEFMARVSRPQFARATIDRLLDAGMASVREGFLSMDPSQRMILAERLIHDGRDPLRVSRVLEWQEFESFANDTLIENGFRTAKHFIFKTSIGRREIDILAWNDNFMLAIDCKHWLRGISGRRMEDAAQAQTLRVRALAKRPELLARVEAGNLARRSIMPVILRWVALPTEVPTVFQSFQFHNFQISFTAFPPSTILYCAFVLKRRNRSCYKYHEPRGHRRPSVDGGE